MAYRGTGTQADPFIPGSTQGTATITDLLEVLDYIQTQSITEAYVVLDSDIDCYDDPNYVGYTSALKFASGSSGNPPGVASFTSDNGNRTIRGLTVKDPYFMILMGYDSNLYTTIDGINFIDCFFKPTSSSVCYIFGGPSNDSSAILRNSTISMTVYSNTNTSQPSVPVVCERTCNFVNCSMYFKYNTDAMTAYNTKFLCTSNAYSRRTRSCVFVFDGLHINYSSSWDYPLIYLAKSDSSYNSFIFKNCIVESSGYYSTLVLSYGSYNYVAFVNPSLNNTDVKAQLQGFSGTSHCLCASDKLDTVFIPQSVSSNLGEYCTLTQLKDVDYLLSVGFVP